MPDRARDSGFRGESAFRLSNGSVRGARPTSESKRAELQDRALRLQAEFDNFPKTDRKRPEPEFAQYAGMEIDP